MTPQPQFERWYAECPFRNLPWSAARSELELAYCAGWRDGMEPRPPALAVPSGIEASDIYAAYPRKIGKGAALKAIAKAMKTTPATTLLGATREYATAVKAWPASARYTVAGVDTVPHPATWYNQERFTDDRAEWSRNALSASRFGTTH